MRVLIPTKDGGFFGVGSTNSTDGDLSGLGGDSVQSDAWVLKLDAQGNIQWQLKMGGAGGDEFDNAIQTSDGGYLAVGITNSPVINGVQTHYYYDALVVKLSSSGKIEWTRCLGGTGYDQAVYAVENPGETGGYVISCDAGSTNGDVTSNHGGAYDLWVVELDPCGGLVWQHTYGGKGIDECGPIVPTADHGYLIAASTTSTDGDVHGYHGDSTTRNPDVWLVKLDAAGTLQWSKCLGGTGRDNLSSIVPLAGGDMALGGSTNSLDGDVVGVHSDTANGQTDAWVVRIGPSGELRWQRCIGGSDGDFAASMIARPDGRLMYIGSTASSDAMVVGRHRNSSKYTDRTDDAWVVSLDSSGRLLGQRCIGGSATDYGTSIIPLRDGSFVVAGTTDSDDGDVVGYHEGGYFDAWVASMAATADVGRPSAGQGDGSGQALAFPNPASDQVMLRLPASYRIEHLALVDVCGRAHQVPRSDDGSTAVLDVRRLTSGFYQVQVVCLENGVQRRMSVPLVVSR